MGITTDFGPCFVEGWLKAGLNVRGDLERGGGLRNVSLNLSSER